MLLLNEKRLLAGELMGRSGLATLWRGLRRLNPGREAVLPILAYHRVLDLPDDGPGDEDPHLVSASVADFEAQMVHVARHFHPVGFTEVLASLDGGPALPAHAIVVTFDDGHLDNYENAFPILRRLGVPATIFVATAYIDSGAEFWFNRLVRLLNHAPAGPLAAIDGLGVITVPAPACDRLRLAETLLARFKALPDLMRQAACAAVDDQLAPYLPLHARQRASFDWDQAREMAAAGIEIASHTINHPVLSQLDDATLDHELRESRAVIHRELGRDLPVVAYPVGKVGAYDERVMAAARACGYRLGLSYEHGVTPLASLPSFDMRRLAVERYTTRSYFNAMLSLPEVFR